MIGNINGIDLNDCPNNYTAVESGTVTAGNTTTIELLKGDIIIYFGKPAYATLTPNIGYIQMTISNTIYNSYVYFASQDDIVTLGNVSGSNMTTQYKVFRPAV